MLLFDGALGLIALALWLFCIIDVITTPEYLVRNLPKLLWLLLVIVLAEIGAIAWLIAGRPWGESERLAMTARPKAPAKASNPDDDEEFLAGLRARAEEQRRRAREQQQSDDEGQSA